MFRNQLLFVLLFLFVFVGFRTLLAEKNSLVEYRELPSKVLADLQTFIEKYNKSKEPLDDFAPFDPKIVNIPKDGYYFAGKYLIPVSKSGTNFAFTIFLLWDKKIYECFTTDGFVLTSLKQIKDYPILKASYMAGCCDFRYYATGLISIQPKIPFNLFIIPQFAKNEKENISSPYVYENFYFKLFLTSEITKLQEGGTYKININCWALDQSYKLTLNDFSFNELSGIKDSPADLKFSLMYDDKAKHIYIPKREQNKIKFLTKAGWPNKKLDFQILMKTFINWMKENPALLDN